MSDDDEENEKDLAKNMKELLASLTPREAKVLRERFGINLKDNQELEDIGDQFDISQEKIREVERKALTKLRHQRSQNSCLLYTSPSPRDGLLSRMPSSA